MNAPIQTMPARLDLRLAAIDLDGTLLGPDLTISDENRRAIERLRRASIEVVLASGRHFESIRPFARQLPEVRWIVSAQGGEVSDVDRSVILSRSLLASHETNEILRAGERLGLTALVYTPDGILTEADAGERVAFYRRLSGNRLVRLPRAELARASAYKVLWIGEAEHMEAFRDHPIVGALKLQVLRTHARLLELMPVGVGKGTGLGALAAHLGLRAAQAAAFGDAENDLPMFDWAGVSVAMPHGWPAALERARWIAPPGPAETALARAIDLVLAETAGAKAVAC